jgi:hypothetical protein
MSDEISNWKVDKTGWREGPWLKEPDRLEWRDDATGLPCLIVRAEITGALCGYVGVPPGHPAHKNVLTMPVEALEAHGGINYASKCSGPVCHLPAPGEADEVWWLGFDCAHAWDYSPGLDAMSGMRLPPGGLMQYRDVEYVRREITELARQCAELAAPPQATP